MGVKYSAADSAQLIQAMTGNLQAANQVTDRLSSGCDHLIASLESGELQGAAYTAGKGLFTEVIIPAIKKLQEAIDDIQGELASYKSADSEVAGYGELDLDLLKEQLKIKNEQLAKVEKQIADNQDFFRNAGALLTGKLGDLLSQTSALMEVETQLNIGIREIQEKIDKLEWFVDQVSQYFTDSLQVLGLAIQGATQLSQVLVDSEGNYSTDGIDMSWSTKMKVQEIQTYSLDSETVEKANLRNLNKKVEEIKESDKSATDKIDSIIKAYEDYLFYSNKDVFESYWKKRNSLTKGGEINWSDVSRQEKDDLEQDFNKSLKTKVDIKALTKKMGESILEVSDQDINSKATLLAATGSMAGYKYVNFATLVYTDRPMDLKNREYSKEMPISIWSRQWEEGMAADYLGNYLYGYFGQGYLPAGDDVLKYGAGKAQQFSDYLDVDKYFIVGADIKYDLSLLQGHYGDNEGDAAMIQDGIDAYKKENKE